jgi:hypothetical protein
MLGVLKTLVMLLRRKVMYGRNFCTENVEKIAMKNRHRPADRQNKPHRKTAAVQALPGGTGVVVIVSIDEYLGPFGHVGRCSGKSASKWHISRAGRPGGLSYSPSFHFRFRRPKQE